MKIREYDDKIYIESLEDFREIVYNEGFTIDIDNETDGYCNLYVNNSAVSYLHSFSSEQISAIDYLLDNTDKIFQNLLIFLQKEFNNPKKELGLAYINVLNKSKDQTSFTEYVFVNLKKEKTKVVMLKDVLV